MKTPVFFIGHGSPLYALQSNSFTKSVEGMRDLCPDPRAVLCVSAHWMTEGTWVTNMANPRTIHDFYGFPQELFDVQYPAPGSPEVASLVRQTAGQPHVHADDKMWGLDHGTWSVLRHLFPEAKIPVLQLSLFMSRPASYHYELGQRIRALRDQGVLIVGSGNIVHNLRTMRWEPGTEPYDWAVKFDEWSKEKLLARDDRALVEDYLDDESGKLSVPSPDHYYPLLTALGAADPEERPRFIFEEIHNGSISMRTLAFGAG